MITFAKFLQFSRGVSRGVIAPEFLVKMIIAIAVIVVIFAIASKVGERISSSDDVLQCKRSMITMSLIVKGALGIVDAPINCPAVIEKTSVKNNVEGYQTIAEHLRSCWDKSLGKDNPVVNYRWSLNPADLATWNSFNTFCMVCSEFTVDDTVTELNDNNKVISGISTAKINDYLKVTPIPNTDTKYFDFLDTSLKEKLSSFFRSSFDFSEISSSKTPVSSLANLFAGEKYAVVFVKHKSRPADIKLPVPSFESNDLANVMVLPVDNAVKLLKNSELCHFSYINIKSDALSSES